MNLSNGITWGKEFGYQKIDNNQPIVVGKIDFYPYQQLIIEPNFIYQLKPHLCPVCKGKCVVSSDFYMDINNNSSISNKSYDQCRSCQGRGIIWG
jgi:hypothetical protein